ncbi:putative MFS quinate transporter [Bisporella sp. PMI_857]|nr:putative MFS quinate transporter [Bisporella sp. PMI_857]
MAFLLRKIVHNDAMKEDPPEIYNRRAFLLACSSCFGAMSFGMDGAIISGVIVLPEFIADYGLNTAGKVAVANLQANIVSTLQAGCFIGALNASWISDKWGRKIALTISAVVTFIGVILQFCSFHHLEPLYIGRFVAGLGVGCASMVNPLYIAENAPRAIRGALTGMYQFFIVFGAMIAFWINYGASLHLHGDVQYILPLAIQGLPAIFLFVGMLLCNESPRWFAQRDEWEKAKDTLRLLRGLPDGHPYLEEEFQEIFSQLGREREVLGDSSFWALVKEMWTIPRNRKTALISIALMVCQQMTGTNAINNYAPQMFKNLGIVGSSTSLFATGIYGVVKLTGVTIFLIFVADSLGRRRSLLWTSIGQGCCMLYIGIYIRIDPPLPGADVPPAGYVALICIFLFAAFFQFGWGPVCWIYVSEIPTTRMRSLNVALAAATQWLFNFVVARAVPNMLVSAGAYGYGTYMIFGSFCFSMFVFVWFFIPETKGIHLEQMDILFGSATMRGGKLDADEEKGEATSTAKEIDHADEVDKNTGKAIVTSH